MSKHGHFAENPVPVGVRGGSENSNTSLKRKRDCRIEIDENMSDNSTDRSKRANFSAIPSNGINRNLTVLNIKPTATKKIIIKNFKSKCFHARLVVNLACIL